MALIAGQVIVRPRGGLWREALRLLPDLLRLLPWLGTDRNLPRRTRVALALLPAYLAFPGGLAPPCPRSRASWRITRSLTLLLAGPADLSGPPWAGGEAARADSSGGWYAAADAPDGTS
jgi:hypothetical protein